MTCMEAAIFGYGLFRIILIKYLIVNGFIEFQNLLNTLMRRNDLVRQFGLICR